MKVLLATHNFLPFHTGGTEIYVLHLAKSLIAKGHQVAIIAAIAQQADHQLIYNDNHLTICTYEYDYLTIFGATYKNIITEQLYSKRSSEHQKSYEKFLNKFQFEVMHIHGFTATIGLDLLYAVKKNNIELKVITSYHTAISDPKETLTFANTATELKEKVNSVADMISHRFDIPYCLAHKVQWLLPNWNLKSLPALFNIKYLAHQSLKSFRLLIKETNEWWVYSKGIKNHLITLGVDGNLIKFERHGISALFVGKKNKASAITKFLFNGRLVKIKGSQILLKAWLNLEEDMQKQLWITGNPSSNDKQINALLVKAKTRKDIVWLGQLTQFQLAQYYLQVHYLIIPSICYETGPLVFHEAIASGCHVIASNIGGCKELAEYYHDASTTFIAAETLDLTLKIQSAQGVATDKSKQKVLTFEQHFVSFFNQSVVYD